MYEAQYKNYNADFVMYELLLDKKFPVVEFGSGTGRITLHLLSRGFTVYGIEKEEEYRDYLMENVKLESSLGKFKFIKSISEIDFPCYVIFPFNVLFFLNDIELERELQKVSEIPFKKIIFETDNIFNLSEDNFLTKQNRCDDKIFNETVEYRGETVFIKNEITQGDNVVLKFSYTLFLHHARKLLKLFKTYFKQFICYGDFYLSNYTRHSTKLIVVVEKTDNIECDSTNKPNS